MTLRTHYVDGGFESTVPRGLWIEVVGEADRKLDEAINVYWNLANQFLPILTVAVNAPTDDLDVHLAFDGTEGQLEHEFFEHFVPDDTGLPTHGRQIPLQETDALVGAIETSPHRPRMQRACAFYREAVRYLHPGQEVLFVVFLWMAVEALTKVAIRRACVAHACDEEGLLVAWNLVKPGDKPQAVKAAKRQLDGEARRRLIFHGDGDCQRDTRNASDGFEARLRRFR